MRISTLLLAALLSTLSGSAVADAYADCRARASQRTGYHGPTPNAYKEGGAFRGATRGAVMGGATSAILGGSGSEGAKRGALIGGVLGGVRRANANQAEKQNQVEWQHEVDRCMSGGK